MAGADPVAAGVVELYESLAPARVDRVGELPVLFNARIRRDGELPLRRASAFRDAAVLGDDDAGTAVHGAVVIYCISSAVTWPRSVLFVCIGGMTRRLGISSCPIRMGVSKIMVLFLSKIAQKCR